jgi:hypothetical protein
VTARVSEGESCAKDGEVMFAWERAVGSSVEIMTSWGGCDVGDDVST